MQHFDSETIHANLNQEVAVFKRNGSNVTGVLTKYDEDNNVIHISSGDSVSVIHLSEIDKLENNEDDGYVFIM
ncbi:hypothetical protein [Tumebacillus permanentifrigoris]|uniref:YolD-like protein n=1 Tax=Tumebacillus permanentifrigoris TaxID=378543 RepID=A0A316D6J4_9BACL|nr:hypothetical protein [Tumebacillus permanentifrigoris]PWK07511.1 hypothetical protein C7459_117110 [Tumebacillus permanentifrigoris]